MQAGLNSPTGQSDDRDFFARGSARALKQQGHLRLLSAFADQAE
jgi:hypothetical protein